MVGIARLPWVSNNQVILSTIGIINAAILVSGLKRGTIIVQLLEEKIMMAFILSFVLLLFMSLIESRFIYNNHKFH
jgi:hypothetical protein